MRALRLFGLAVAGLAGLLGLAFVGLQTTPGQAGLARVVTRLASGPEGGLQVRGLAGFFPTDLQVRDIAYADRQGTWLMAEDVRLRWSFLALLGGRLQVEQLAARRIAVLRMPLASSGANSSSGGGTGLPVGIDVKNLEIADLHIGRDLVGAASDWKVSGAATVPASLRDGTVRLEAQRSDGPAGSLRADLRFDLDRMWVDGTAAVTEGQGGLVGVLLERSDLGAFSLELQARGDASNGTATLKAAAADAARANGTLTWQSRRDGATIAVLRLDTAGPGLPAGALADAVRQPMHLEADAAIDAKAIEVSRVSLTAGPQSIEGRGRYDRAADRASGSVTLRSGEPAGLAALAGGLDWRGLRVELSADIEKPASVPRGTVSLTGHGDRLSATAIDSRLPEFGPIDLRSEARLEGDRIVVSVIDMVTAVARLEGSGSYARREGAAEARARLSIPDLAPLSAVAGRALHGNVVLDLAGNGRWQPDGTWTLGEVRVQSDAGRLTASGSGRNATAALDIAVDLPSLAALDPSVTGAARANARIVRSEARMEARLDTTLSDLQRGPLVARTLTLSADGALEATGAASGRVKMDGDLAAQPLSLEGRFSLDAQGRLRVPTLQGRWASAVLDIADFAIAGEQATGHARLQVARLEDAAALAGTPLAGAIDLDLSADAAEAGRRLVGRLEGRSLRAGALAVSALDLKATVERPGPDLSLDAKLSAKGIAGAADIASLEATAKGSLADLAVALQANGPATRASLEAGLAKSGDELAIALRRFDGSYRAIPVALASPGRIVLAGQRVTVEPLALRIGSGRIAARGTLDESSSDLTVEIAALPLQLAEAFAPGSGLDGSLQAKVQVRGALSTPTVDATYSVPALRLRSPEAALLPPIALQGTAGLAGRAATAQVRASAAGGTALTVNGKATLPQGAAPLAASASVTGNVELAPFSPLLGNDVRNVTGRLRPNLTVEIAGSQVSGSGSIDLSNAALTLPEAGLRLSGGQGRLVLQGSALQVQQVTFQTAGNGTVGAGGTVTFDPAGSVRPDLTLTSRSALLVNRPDLVARVSANLRVTGDTASAIDVAGPITIERAEVSIGSQQSAAFPTIEVREVDKPGATAAAVAAAPRPPQKLEAPPTGVPVRLNLTIDAPQAVFVRGRGLDAEMGGRLAVGGTPASPTVTGALTMRRGEFNLLARRMTFRKGVVTLDNLDRIDPLLDFVATTSVQSTIITVSIKGTARAPEISISASPELPPDEAMAMLLFGKPASGLSLFELAQAAQGLAELTGQASGAGALGRLRGGLGLDRLSVDSGKGMNAPVSVEAGRYVAPGIYVGARQGATGNSSRGVVQIEVLDHVKIEGDIGADSNGRVGVKTEWDY